jgi:hypothetical protein
MALPVATRDQNAAQAADEGEQQALDEQLPHDRAASGAREARIAISRVRAADRASSMLATLKQAMSRNTLTTASNKNSGARTSPPITFAAARW